MVEPDGIEPTTSSMPCMLPFLDRQPAGMRPYTRKTSSEKCALASLMPTDFIFPSAAALAVTTFPQSADTDGEAVTTSRLRPARTPARGCARGAAMWRSPLGASAVRVTRLRPCFGPIFDSPQTRRTPKGAAPRPAAVGLAGKIGAVALAWTSTSLLTASPPRPAAPRSTRRVVAAFLPTAAAGGIAGCTID